MDIKLKFAVLTLLVILFQSSLKLIGVIMTGSLSFLSETVDTFIDILFVSITLYSLYQSQKPADYEHMYGHSKIDSISGLIQGIILMNVYLFLIYNAIQTLISSRFDVANPEIGLVLLILSFLVNLFFSRVLISKGRQQKSLTMEIQGLNLFQDSMRAILVFLSFIFAYFDIIFLDPIFSIVLSVWIIFGAIKLAKAGIKELTDTNPVSSIIIEELRTEIFALEHVVGVHDLKVRASGKTLFLEVHLSVEDHISVVHANEIIKSIRKLSSKVFPLYQVECIVEMNPLASEKSIGEGLINLIYSMKSEYPNIINFKDLNIFRLEEEYFVSLIVVVDESLSLTKAHKVCTEFELEIKKQAPYISRIITHIEGQLYSKSLSANQIKCADVGPEMLEQIKNVVEGVLRQHSDVKGYHGLEFWATLDYCILELHIFFDGSLNISQTHTYISELEKSIRDELGIDNLDSVFLHSEPMENRTDGILF
ncbi:MAG: cation diffusion facilitator family transporter [Candidatus Lokiarchaeota archaeon]|nr:cation diffusion facilitator family transporter [Candidatus Lokiarchaeota archaeon]